MDPSYNQPLSEDQMNIAIYLANRSFFIDFLCRVSDETHHHHPSSNYPSSPPDIVDVPRTGTDVVKLIMSSKFGCTKLLNGYVKLGFGPSHVMVPLENRDTDDGQQTGFVRFLEALYEGNTLIRNRARIVTIFDWFIQLQSNIHHPSASDLGPMTTSHKTTPGRPRTPIDHLTEMLKWQTAGPTIHRRGVNLTCMMIEKLCAKGAVIDLYQDRFLTNQQTGKLKRPNNAVEIAMMPQCPVSFLQVFLSSRTHEEQRFVAIGPVWKSSGANLARGMHYAVTNMEWIITRIYRDIFEETKHVSGRLHIDREYEEKVSLLGNPFWTDGVELRALRKLVEVVEGILHEIDESDFQRGEAFKYQSWFRLCHAVSGLADTSYRVNSEESSKYFGDRRHQFVIDLSWDPRFEWMEAELDKQILKSDSHISWTSRDEVASVWRKMIIEQGGHEWWDVEEHDFYVMAWEVEQALEDAARREINGLCL
ncbi:hypothetical protein FVEN_g12047 [Fusarium venenatum]|uniref:Uncharacterized protein n=1 Tax=Fusarium venenatum TaxID=56646 RepID=A0A2L2SWZ0_9HYPO|nr:uncharacterized protein FVRRES_06788 [Fusarium venenatum]KAG8349772.1 hypothetical protein FVEN_g12047 [Fusarium venenatum]KAH6993757.1 hypothetical protein EDB82DRAFT_499851 [Fusarium venenatum]CEI62352.1 unnamed protein product [Fusarium venenatum]